MTGKGILDTTSASVSAALARALEGIFGSGIHRPIIGPITGADLGVLLCFALLVTLVHGIAAAVLRRKEREAARKPEARPWHSQAFEAVGKPLYLLIWIYGIYFIATPLLLRLPTSEDERHPARMIFDKLFDLGVFVVVLWVFFRLTRVLEAQLQRWAARSESRMDDVLVPLLGKSMRVVVPMVAIILALPVIGLPPEYSNVVSKASGLLIIGAITWILFQAVAAGERLVLSRYDIKVSDNLQARKVFTQVHVISKTIYVVIAIFAVASGLMLFEEVRRFGTSILASAGVIGIIVGFAAQRTIANLFAGFQLAMTQPIRIDDVVIVENEWGRVEELTLTYVIIRIWDERRLVVPLNYFIERPFQNWTRVSAELLGSVFVWVDYTLPVPELRQETQRIVESCADWDRRFWNFQVTDTTERTMQVRVLATAADSGKAWNLRCEIREKLIAVIQRKYPGSLPRFRGELAEPRQEPRREPGA